MNVRCLQGRFGTDPAAGGGFTVTSPALPELITEGDTLQEALDHGRDALAAVLELYHDLGRSLPASLRQDPQAETITLEYPLTVARRIARSPGNCDALAARKSHADRAALIANGSTLHPGKLPSSQTGERLISS